MENTPRMPDKEDPAYEEYLPENSNSKKESIIRQSREILNNIIPDALEADKKEQLINIDHHERNNRSKPEKYSVENTSIESTRDISDLEQKFESRPEQSEADFEKKHEAKGDRIKSSIPQLEEDRKNNSYDSQPIPVSEVIKNIKRGDNKIAIKTHQLRTNKPKATVSQLQVVIIGFIFGLICLLILINRT
jgi:hypothetical protein